MYLNEAEKKVGVNGKIRRRAWGEEYFLKKIETIDGKGLWINHCPEDTSMHDKTSKISVQDAIATDWQVVEEPTIKVGDWVRWGDIGSNVKVVGINKTKQEACLLYDDNSFNVFLIKELTLIRKGPKQWEFENVSWHNIEGYSVPLNGINPCIIGKKGKLIFIEEESHD